MSHTFVGSQNSNLSLLCDSNKPDTSTVLFDSMQHPHGKYEHHHPTQVQYLMKPNGGENISVYLQNRELWKKFNDQTNEMIVTKAGRRMFPIISISIRGLEPEKMYSVELSFDQVDSHRWRYVSGQWQAGTKPDPPILRPAYQHPDSPNYGKTWMKDVILFSKVKLTNKTNHTGPCQMVLNSLHKYRPKIAIFDELLKKRIYETSFPETEFIAVTAYQNDDVTSLKIKYNPFAKAFLDSGNNKRDEREMSMLEEQHANGNMNTSNNYSPSFPHHSMFFSHHSSPMSTGPDRMKLQTYRSSPYGYHHPHTYIKSSPTDAFQPKLDPYPSSSTSPFDPSSFYASATPATCSSSSPLSPNPFSHNPAAYYPNPYYSSPASYYFPYGNAQSPAPHPFMAPLACQLSNVGTSSSPVTPPLLNISQVPQQQQVGVVPNGSNPSTSSSPTPSPKLYDSSVTTEQY